MKLAKVLLLVSATFLMACNSTASTSTKIENTSTSTVESTSSVEDSVSTPSSTSEESTSSSASSSVSSTSSSSSVESTSSSVSSSSEAPVTDKELTFTFLNPSCGSQGTESLNAKLKDEMNTMAGFEFVTTVDNTSCQFMADAPTAGSQILTIGSAKRRVV